MNGAELAGDSHDWQPGPREPQLEPGAVHVWRADLRAGSDDLGALLDAGERARAGRISRERERRLWIRSRGLLRTLLARYLHVEPRSLCFASGPRGKPELCSGAAGRSAPGGPAPGSVGTLSFNLSHSGHTALYAFAASAPMGVDVELAGRSTDLMAVAERAFGATEARRLAALDPPVRELEFLRAWVRHEAKLKCLGTGLGGADSGHRGPDLWVAELDVGPRAAAAVATLEQPRAMSCWEWPPGPEATPA
jgi:4'-phosphopantetheinyl transferase